MQMHNRHIMHMYMVDLLRKSEQKIAQQYPMDPARQYRGRGNEILLLHIGYLDGLNNAAKHSIFSTHSVSSRGGCTPKLVVKKLVKQNHHGLSLSLSVMDLRKVSTFVLVFCAGLAHFPYPVILFSSPLNKFPSYHDPNQCNTKSFGAFCGAVAGFRYQREFHQNAARIPRIFELGCAKSSSSGSRPALAEGLREREITLKNKEGEAVTFHVIEAAKTTDMVDDWIQDQMATVSRPSPFQTITDCHIFHRLLPAYNVDNASSMHSQQERNMNDEMQLSPKSHGPRKTYVNSPHQKKAKPNRNTEANETHVCAQSCHTMIVSDNHTMIVPDGQKTGCR